MEREKASAAIKSQDGQYNGRSYHYYQSNYGPSCNQSDAM
jgi:hypothetical protein